MRVLIAFGTTHGQTARIAGRIAARLREAGVDVVLSDVRSLPRRIPFDEFDAILVGGSLQAGGYQRRVKRFIRENLESLGTRTTAFISVCMAIASKNAADRKEAAAIPRRFVAQLGWKPDEIAVFAGALAFTRYGFLTRFVMRRIAEKEMQTRIDPTCDHEFTNWVEVDEFAAAFLRRIERRRSAVVHLRSGVEAEAAPQANA